METQTQQIPTGEGLNFERIWAMFQESKTQLQETKEILREASLVTEKKFQETNQKFQETDKKFQQTDKQIKEIGKQIGGLGNKFGTFNEGLFMPSLETILKKQFKCHLTFSNYKFYDNGNTLEIDLLGETNDACYIVEIKSHLREEVFEQLEQAIKNFKKYDKKYADKQIYGIIAATHYTEKDLKQVHQHGFHFISTNDEIAKLKDPKGFKAKNWQQSPPILHQQGEGQ